MVFPLIKLGYLFLKQISKPIANGVKAHVKRSPRFKFICMKPAQLYHSMDVNIRMRLLGLGKAEKVEPLTEAMAIDLGAELVGESVIYGMGALILYFEWSRSSQKDELKETARKNEILELENKVQDLAFRTENQEARLREYRRLIYDLDEKNQSMTSRIFGSDQNEYSKAAKRVHEFTPLERKGK